MELIKKLCNAYGPSGREDGIRKIIQAEVEKYSQKTEVDCLGNLIAFVPSSKSRDQENTKKTMFCAHMDEIGLIVNHIDKKGFLRFTSVGGIFPDQILLHRVIFENGTLGVIGKETKQDKSEPLRIANLFIDICAKNKEEAEKKVSIGDIAALFQEAKTRENRLLSKALDDRIGCYCLIEAMKRIKKNSDDLYFVFSVQEEVGLRGARTGAYGISPQYAIAVDVTRTGDTPECKKMEMNIGKGTAIKIKDERFLANPFVKDKLIAYAQEANIPYQLEILEKGTTDAAAIQVVKQGVLSGVLSVPTRYIHSSNEVCDLDDVEATIQLIVRVCEKGLVGS